MADQFFLPPCNDKPADPSKAQDASVTGQKLVHDCYDPRDLQPIGKVPAPPELRSMGEQAADLFASLVPSNDKAAPIETQLQQVETADKTLEHKAWIDFQTRRDILPTEDARTAAYYALMRGYGLTTREDGKGTLTPEQLHFVNNYGLSNCEHDGQTPANNPHFVRKYTEQTS